MIPEVAIASKHVQMEKDFLMFCNQKGFEVADLSYHHNFDDGTAETLRRDFSPSSLSVRTKPDLLIQKSCDGKYKSIFVELKTGNSRNVQMEAFQLLQNKIIERGIKAYCLYVYRGKLSGGKMLACYSDKIRVSKLVIPKAPKNNFIRPILENSFQVPVEERDYIQGFSNDPYVEVTDLSNWLPVSEYIK